MAIHTTEVLMEPISSTTAAVPGADGASASATSELTSQDFLQLLVTQLTAQDPFEPMGNEELLRQISSIRDIELSTNLTESLQGLKGQQNFSSASGLIGKHVTTNPDAGGGTVSGVVTGVRFNGSGEAVLMLSSGVETPLANVSSIQAPLQAAEALVGLNAVGVDRRDQANPRPVEGLVTSARIDEQGDVMLELDTGDVLRLKDLVSVSQEAAA